MATQTDPAIATDTQRLMDLERDYLLQNYARYPLVLHRGKGCYVYEPRGKRYLDLIAGIGVNALGHAHPRLTKVIREQAGPLLHTSNLYYHEYQGPLAERIARVSGLARMFFCNSGTEAMEGALKMIRAHGHKISPEKYEIVALDNSFHGRTFGALSITGQEKYRSDFEPMLPGRAVRRAATTSPRWKQVVTERTAGIVIEIVQGEGGINPLTRRIHPRGPRTGGSSQRAAGVRRDPVRRGPPGQVLRLSVAGSRDDARYHRGGQAVGLRTAAGSCRGEREGGRDDRRPASTAPPSAADRWPAAWRSSSSTFWTGCCPTSISLGSYFRMQLDGARQHASASSTKCAATA